MSKVHDRLRCDAAPELAESNTEHETINSLIEALSSVSDSLPSSPYSPVSSSSSVASLSLNFTVPVPDPQDSIPAAAPHASAGSSDKLRPRRPRRQLPEAAISQAPVSEVARGRGVRPVQAAASTRNSSRSTARGGPLSVSAKSTPSGAAFRAEHCQPWKVATGQPRGGDLPDDTSVAPDRRFLAIPPARFSAYSSTPQPRLQHRRSQQPLHMAPPLRAGVAHATPTAVARSQPLVSAPHSAAGQRQLAAIRTANADTASLSMDQLNELAEIMDEIIKRMTSSLHGVTSELSTGGGSGEPLVHPMPSQAESQELSMLLLEAEQVMVALRQLPSIGGSSSSSLVGVPMRSMLHKVQSWVEYSQLSSVYTGSTSHGPLSPLSFRSPAASPRQTLSMSPAPLSERSYRSLTISPRHTIATSDSDMDFIPALALPVQPNGARRGTGSLADASVRRDALHSAPDTGVAAVAASDSPVAATPLPPTSHSRNTELPVGVPTVRPAYASKAGSSTDTLPGPPATPFSAASDSDAVGPSTPSNSFAQGSGGTRPASLPATHSHAILPVQEGACSDAHVSATLDTHDTISGGTAAWVELPHPDKRQGARGKSGTKGGHAAASAQLTRSRWSLPFHTCFGSNTGVRRSGGTPRQVSRKITADKKNKKEGMRIGCSCL